MKIITNTYPKIEGVAHAEIGDEVNWELSRGAYRLKRKSDNKTVFSTSEVDKNGLLRSNGKQPILTGIIASVISKGWYLEVI